jgi:hypothetical protein
LDAPFTLANAMALPATKRITPIRTNMVVCFFTALPPLTTGGRACKDPNCCPATVGSRGGYDGKGSTYIGLFDHCSISRPR